MSRRRYPLETLIKVREHRTEKARQLVLERLAKVRECLAACTRIEGEIQSLRNERAAQRARLLDPPPAGVAWPTALAQREAHADLLAAKAEAAGQRLQAARQAQHAAEAELDEARKAFSRTRSRLDALIQRREAWRREEAARAERLDDLALADLVSARHTTRSEVNG
ncbi:hypothetical protein [Coralloluteibacterium thermophilus]|uniref:Type III secretion protein n=1 Tax=Coralloluteibacterium thermophilum TaxID=2707049 RepID=A0ABV9NNE1_9GAMM